MRRFSQPMYKKLMAGPYLLWMIVFTLVPLLFVFYYGFTDSDGSFTLSNITAIADKIHLEALGLSLLLAFLSTAICLLLAYPLALILSKNSSNSRSFIIFIFILPMWINFLLRIIAIRLLIADNGIINNILSFFHLPSMNIMYTPAAIVLGMVYDYFPFMVLPIYNALIKIDRNLLDAAGDLGANSWKKFIKVIFPLSIPGVVSGITMVFVPSISEFVIADILGGGKILLIGNIIEQEFNRGNNWNLGSGISIVLMIFIFISMMIADRKSSGEEAALW
ncbi:MAG: ABC transporter permease [Oscillospiraceae bacterium]|nr:ABC transporter permease [Oscillospiraceae bacterium]